MDRNQFNPSCLGEYFFQLFDHLDKCFLLNKEILTVIDEDYERTSRDNYTGQKTSVSLRDYVKWTTDNKKRNGEKKCFIFFNVLFLASKNLGFESFIELKQWFYKDLDNIAAFHFHLTNIILLLMNDHREGEFYCFCNKVKKKKIRTLYKFQYYFSRDKKKGEERLERFQHNHNELKKLLTKCCDI